MIPVLAVLLHGDDVDLIYFWSSVFMILLPITTFTVLTYFVVKASRRAKASSKNQ